MACLPCEAARAAALAASAANPGIPLVPGPSAPAPGDSASVGLLITNCGTCQGPSPQSKTVTLRNELGDTCGVVIVRPGEEFKLSGPYGAVAIGYISETGTTTGVTFTAAENARRTQLGLM
jgi:hypothetical protein